MDFFILHSEDLYFSGLKFISFTSLANNFNSTLNSKGSESPELWDYFFLQHLDVFLLDSTFLDYLVLSWLGDNGIFGELGPERFKPRQHSLASTNANVFIADCRVIESCKKPADAELSFWPGSSTLQPISKAAWDDFCWVLFMPRLQSKHVD